MLYILTTTVEGIPYKKFQSEMCPSPDPPPVPSPRPPLSPGASAAISAVAVISFMVFVLVINHLRKKASNAQGHQSSDPERNEEMPAYGIPVASKVDNFPHVIPVPVQWSPPPPSAPPLHPNE